MNKVYIIIFNYGFYTNSEVIISELLQLLREASYYKLVSLIIRKVITLIFASIHHERGSGRNKHSFKCFFFSIGQSRRQRSICNFYYANSINNSNTYVWARIPRRTNIQSGAICLCCLPRSRKVTMRGEARFTIVTGRLLPTSITLRDACLALTMPGSFKLWREKKKQSYSVMHRACCCTTV